VPRLKPWPISGAKANADSVDAADEAFEVAGFGEGENLGVVGGGGSGFEELDAAVGVGGGGGEDGGEVFERDVVGAGVGDEGSAGGEQAKGAEVELLVAAGGGFGGAPGLGEGRWVEDDGVVEVGAVAAQTSRSLRCGGKSAASGRDDRAAGGVEVAEVVEGVGFDPVGDGLEVGVEGEVLVGGFEGGAAGVDASDAVADLGEVEGEAALVGADVECSMSATGGADVFGCGGVVEALVEEGAGLLAGGCVVGEAEAVEGEEGGGGGIVRLLRRSRSFATLRMTIH